MTLPSFVLGLMFSLLVGALFHVWRDGGPWRLLYYLALSVAGFFSGHWIGVWRNWILFPIGSLDLGLGAAGGIVFLGIGYWLGLVEVGRAGSHSDKV